MHDDAAASADPARSFPDDPRVGELLALVAREARIDPAVLAPAARIDELGVGSLDFALVIFEIEDRYEVTMPPYDAVASAPTVATLVREALAAIDEAREPVPIRA